MAKTATLHGKVSDASGAPVADATVAVYRRGSPRAAGRATTGADGKYRIGKLELRKTYSVRIKVGDGRQDVGSVRLVRSETTLDISLPLGGPQVPMETTTSATGSTSSATTASGSTSSPPTSTSPPTPAIATVEPGFASLKTTLHDPAFAPEPPVNIGEARELARLFSLSMFLLAQVPESINRLYSETRPNYQIGDLTIQRMDQPDPGIRLKMQEILDKRTQLFDTEEDILKEIRRALDLGTGAVSSVNGDFKLLYQEFVRLSADDNNGVDPKEVRAQDPAQAAVIINFMRALKRAILRVTQNMSVYGTRGTEPLVDKWSKLVDDSLIVLRYVAENHVVSTDADDQVAWSVLSALTDTPRSTVKAYVVNARDGGDILQLAVDIYEKIQTGAIQSANGLDDESDDFLQNLFFTQGVVVQGKAVSVALKQPATLIRENLTQLWP